jgi:HAD superfamily hydrolase (TIGR01509 family)
VSAEWPCAAIFDFDGLLVDTAHCWHSAYGATLAASGRRLRPRVLATLAGASLAQAAASLEVPVDALRAQLALALACAPLDPLPGARELVRTLGARMPLAVATSGPGDLVERALARVGLEGFTLVVSAETQARAKPAPDVYEAACARLGVEPGDAVAFEDSPVGALAATRAGLTVVYVPSDGLPAGADIEVARLDDPLLLAFLGCVVDARSA